jgi:predicted dithiol-disulfide oxidoreductase (DUF899 family)
MSSTARMENGILKPSSTAAANSSSITYNNVRHPTWDKGCTGCTGLVDPLGDLSLLKNRDTTFVVVSRAPLAKLEAYKAQKGWSIAWFSSFGSDTHS